MHHLKVHDELKGIDASQMSLVEMLIKEWSIKIYDKWFKQMKEEILRFICLMDQPWSFVD